MAVETPVSMPVEDDVRSAIESAWDTTEAEVAPEAPEAPEAKALAEPAAEGPETAEARARDEQGRFAKQEAGQKPVKAEPAPVTLDKPLTKPLDKPLEAPLGAAQPTLPSGPPPGWSVAAKAEFDKLPQPVRDAIANRETEINQGFAKLTEYKGLDPYVEQARQAGASLPQVLDRYMAAEKTLAENFPQGVLDLCRIYNVHPAGLAQVLVGRQAQPGNQPPQQQPSSLDPVYRQISALNAELANIKQAREASEQEAINGQIASFSSDPAHKYFENVKVSMGHLLQTGQAKDMKDAYETACWMNPEIRALQIKEAAAPRQAQQMQAVAQARRASGSIPLGSPVPGAAANGKSEPPSVRAALEEAWSSQDGAI